MSEPTLYIVMGVDGRLYGPVPAEQIREWISQGRANRETPVQTRGSDNWTTLGALPEFKGEVGESVTSAPPPPMSRLTPGPGEALAREIIAQGRTVSIGDCFSRAWELLKRRFWLIVGATAIITLIGLGLGSVPVVGGAASILLTFSLAGGLDYLVVRLIRGQPASLETAFAGFGAAFLPLILGSLVANILTGIGLLLCILPGIYLMIAWHMLAPLLMIDRGLDFWQALECSRRVVTHHFGTFLGLFILGLLLALAGLLACGIGFFLTYPLAVVAVVYAYEDLFGAPAGPTMAVGAAGPYGLTSPAPAATPGETPETTPPAPEAPGGDTPSSGTTNHPPGT